MNETFSVEELARRVNQWCEQHRVWPASGQAGEHITVRNVRYYRALGLLDAPLSGGEGFGEKHRLQLIAIRLLQAQGLPLSRIQQLLFGRSADDLKRIEEQGLAEVKQSLPALFRPATQETWNVSPLNDEFILVSRRGRAIPAKLRERLLEMLDVKDKNRLTRERKNL